MAIFSDLRDLSRDMKRPTTDMSTDAAWEEWGRRDPYFAVNTDPKFRRTTMTEEAREYFFETGRWHVGNVMQIIRQHIDPNFEPRSVLDFGCGVGRALIPFAALAQEVVGLDVSPSMLREARRNCDECKLTNVGLLLSDDSLSSLTGTFDLIHSVITFQHIPPDRGRTILSRLLSHFTPGGIGALQLTYSKTHFAATHGLAPPSTASPVPISSTMPADADPEMQMNPYNMNEIFFLMQRQGVQQFYTEFTDHGGELGLFTFFKMR
jgi:SAM-dependent methyltransferase